MGTGSFISDSQDDCIFTQYFLVLSLENWAKTKLKIAQRNKRLAIKPKWFHRNESGARPGSSCKNISNSLADVLNDKNER